MRDIRKYSATPEQDHQVAVVVDENRDASVRSGALHDNTYEDWSRISVGGLKAWDPTRLAVATGPLLVP